MLADDNILHAALEYAARGWAVFPAERRDGVKKPKITGWQALATTDAETIRRWWKSWPNALIGHPTGRTDCVLDVDIKDGKDGLATLAALGFPALPPTLTARTTSGGYHLYFKPVAGLRSTVGERGRGIGPALDWRGEGGFVVLPSPNSGYRWVEETLGLGLITVPDALVPKPPPDIGNIFGPQRSTDVLDEWGAGKLLAACLRIFDAPKGEQQATLNGQCFWIGRLVGSGLVPRREAEDRLILAGRAMPAYRAAWNASKVEADVRRALHRGMTKPFPDDGQLDEMLEQAQRDAVEAWERADA